MKEHTKFSEQSRHELDLISQQQDMLNEFRQNLDVVPVEFKPDSQRFIVPASLGRAERVIVLVDDACREKKLLFSALYTAYYISFIRNSDDALRPVVSDIFPRFVEYLNAVDVTNKNKMNILKAYETYRVKNDKVKTQSTGIKDLVRALNKALNFEPYGLSFLSNDDFRFLDLLCKTKPAAKDESEQNTLTDWFGFHSWLRLDEIGIGSELFNRIASPKVLTKSLQVTCATALLELHNAKHALINLLSAKNFQRNSFPVPPCYPDRLNYQNGQKNEQYKKDVARYKKEMLNFKQKLFDCLSELLPGETEYRSPSVWIAIEAVIYSQCTSNAYTYVRERLKNKEKVNQQAVINAKRETLFRQQTPNCLLFTHEFIFELADFAQTSTKKGAVPTCKAEHYLFSALMAHQTVAVTDIFRLKRSNFKLVKRQNGKVTHIDSDYFKSRANSVHSTNMVNANSAMGEAILAFINDRTGGMSQDTTNETLAIEKGISKLKTGAASSASTLFRFLSNSTIRQKIDQAISREKSSSVFLEAVNKILDRGVKKETFINQNKGSGDDWLVKCKTASKGRMFGFENIKNSSVHAASDDFDPARLVNNRSHTMQTERVHYLSKENEVWENNCGRITRAVMHDLQCNVFRPSSTDKVLFQSDFTKAVRYIEQRKSDVLSRLKIITEKEQGRVDELGFSASSGLVEGELPDSLFLVESPETVMKLKHYLSELYRTHEQLAKCNPEFLFYTALPTAEWIETVFSNRLFTNETVYEGEVMYKKYKIHLPSLFVAQIGGNTVGQ